MDTDQIEALCKADEAREEALAGEAAGYLFIARHEQRYPYNALGREHALQAVELTDADIDAIASAWVARDGAALLAAHDALLERYAQDVADDWACFKVDHVQLTGNVKRGIEIDRHVQYTGRGHEWTWGSGEAA